MKISFLGFGEAGQAFATNWSAEHRAASSGFDLKILRQDAEIKKRFDDLGISASGSANEAIEGADVIFSLVTADQAGPAAQNARAIAPDAMFLDCNSVSPGTKRENEKTIESYGGRYVDVAVMAPVHPALNKVPMLVSGPHAKEAIKLLDRLGMPNAKHVEGANGIAASVKMIRSIMVKGIEALTAECVLAGKRAGVDERVLMSLNASEKSNTWEEKAAYNLERMSEHGLRRAAEMEEVAKTVEELGLPGQMAHATVKWQRLMGNLGYEATSENYKILADDINNLID